MVRRVARILTRRYVVAEARGGPLDGERVTVGGFALDGDVLAMERPLRRGASLGYTVVLYRLDLSTRCLQHLSEFEPRARLRMPIVFDELLTAVRAHGSSVEVAVWQ